MKLSTIVVSSALAFSATSALAQTDNLYEGELASTCMEFMNNAHRVTGERLYEFAATGYANVVNNQINKGQLTADRSVELVEGVRRVAKSQDPQARQVSLDMTKNCLELAEKSEFFKNFK